MRHLDVHDALCIGIIYLMYRHKNIKVFQLFLKFSCFFCISFVFNKFLKLRKFLLCSRSGPLAQRIPPSDGLIKQIREVYHMPASRPASQHFIVVSPSFPALDFYYFRGEQPLHKATLSHRGFYLAQLQSRRERFLHMATYWYQFSDTDFLRTELNDFIKIDHGDINDLNRSGASKKKLA